MASNTFGTNIRFSSFGESHGPAIGGVLDGLPAGLEVDYSFVEKQLHRRKPVFKDGGTARIEADVVEWLSGIFEGKTTGAPLAFLIRNKQYKSEDYDKLKDVFRPSHADYTYQQKYGIRDYRGGGRASARETAARVVAGALVMPLLRKHDIEIFAAVSRIGNIQAGKNIQNYRAEETVGFKYGFLDQSLTGQIEKYVEQLRAVGDSAGGVVSCLIRNVPAGLGEPVYNKLQSALAAAMMSINAVKGFEYGAGFKAASMTGLEHNDEFTVEDENVRTETNNSGGIQGGISNGEDIYFNVAFKPVASISAKQKTINSMLKMETIEVKGRHDVCVVPRALPVVEAMAALVIADFLMFPNNNSAS